MDKKYTSLKYWGSAAVILAVLISSIISISKSHKKQERIERFDDISEVFLGKTDVEADQSVLRHVDFHGLVADYEPKWMVNTFNMDTDLGDTYLVAFNANGEDFRTAFSVTWYKADPSLSIDEMMKRCKKQLKKQYDGSDVVTTFTETIPDEILGRKGKSLDLTNRAGSYVINKRLVIFRENGYEFRIEKASDISRESLDTYFTGLESRLSIDGITR